MGRCSRCGEIPLATVYYALPGHVEYETEFEVVVVNDGTHDYLLRLSRLVPEYNVVQLKKMEITANSRAIIPLGVRTNTINLARFMEQVANLRLTVEVKPVGNSVEQ